MEEKVIINSSSERVNSATLETLSRHFEVMFRASYKLFHLSLSLFSEKVNDSFSLVVENSITNGQIIKLRNLKHVRYSNWNSFKYTKRFVQTLVYLVTRYLPSACTNLNQQHDNIKNVHLKASHSDRFQ